MFKPTEEQQAAIDAFLTGEDIKLSALAGTGKTSTLEMLANSQWDKRGLYIAFNTSVKNEAESKFPSNVTCKTNHGLAWKPIIQWQNSDYGKRLKNSERMPTRVVADWFGINPFPLRNERELSREHIARMVMDTIQSFCRSNEEAIKSWMVPSQEGMDSDQEDELVDMVLKMAKLGWGDINRRNGTLQFTHDHYLKMWALTNPKLDYDFILLDEAQDTNPVMMGVFEQQTQAQRVVVGDANQSIYSWRGAIDAMSKFDFKELFLSQSFRFGEAVAEQANKFLKLIDSPALVKGLASKDSKIVMGMEEPDVILCRTNSGGIAYVMQYQAQEIPVAMVGGGNDIKNFCYAALKLMKGQPAGYAPLAAFKDWNELLDYVDNDSGGSDLKVSVKLCQTYGPSAVIKAIDSLVPESQAKIVISTAHKAKGREWNRVLIGPDFNSQFDMEKQTPPGNHDLMLDYVTVTRAKEELDMGGLSWIDLVRKGE